MDELEQAREKAHKYVDKTFDKFKQQRVELPDDFRDVTCDEYMEWFRESF